VEVRSPGVPCPEAGSSTDQEVRVPAHPSRARIEEVRSWVAERRLASTVLGGLLVTSLLFWGALLVTTGGDRTRSLAASGPDQPATTSGEEALSPGVEVPDDEEALADEDPPAATAGDDEPSRDHPGADREEAEGDGRTDAAAEEPDGPEGTVVLELDGRCEVEVDAAEEDDPRVHQAWRHPECDLAPLDPTHPDERWIVIVASFSGEQAARDQAAARAARGGHEPKLLWSSHYPSLRPDLWVVYEGPFRDRATATSTADELGPGAYLRQLRPQPPSDEVPPGR
jgi:hypothetical protein